MSFEGRSLKPSEGSVLLRLQTSAISISSVITQLHVMHAPSPDAEQAEI